MLIAMMFTVIMCIDTVCVDCHGVLIQCVSIVMMCIDTIYVMMMCIDAICVDVDCHYVC